MKKLDNYKNCLDVLMQVNFDLAYDDEIYRMGVIGQFDLTLEMAWKALQQILRDHGVDGSGTGSPKEILKLGYKVGFLNDQAVWLDMLHNRNKSAREYNEDEIDELILLIRDSYINAFMMLYDILKKKTDE